jgi:hypothetical protein
MPALTLAANAAHRAPCASGDGRQIWLASVLRFYTVAARWNSSRGPESFRCAKRISTRFLSSRDLRKAFVHMSRRATSRACS